MWDLWMLNLVVHKVTAGLRRAEENQDIRQS
jgi:hypothetical protein